MRLKENSTKTIIKNIKATLFHLQLKNGKTIKRFYDCDVATVLGIPPNALAQNKSRNSIPYREIIRFCVRNNVKIETMLYGTVKIDKFPNGGIS